jgi:ribonuclease HI
MSAKLFFDGASKFNGKDSGAGYWVETTDTSYGGYKYLGNATNNVAEYNGLIIGLKDAVSKKYENIIVHGDSKLVIEQINGNYRVKAEHLKPLWTEVMELIKNFKDIKFVHIDRSLNSKADKFANTAILTKSNLN